MLYQAATKLCVGCVKLFIDIILGIFECIEKGLAEAIKYYWPDQRVTGGDEAAEDGEREMNPGGSPNVGDGLDQRTWNEVPQQAVIGKLPKDLPTANVQKRVIGWRYFFRCGIVFVLMQC